MAYVFVIVFFAALVGVFRPYIKGAKRIHFGIAAFVAFFLVGIFADVSNVANQNETSGTTAASGGKAITDDGLNAVNGPKSEDAPSNWKYSTQKDEMRGRETRYAEVEAKNTISLDFPYGEQRGRILLRDSPQFGFDVLVGVPSGQITCNSYSDSYISVKFDDKPIRRYGCTDASDGSSNMIFVQGEKRFLENLKASKKVVIEAEFFQNGLQQMGFDTANLKWER